VRFTSRICCHLASGYSSVGCPQVCRLHEPLDLLGLAHVRDDRAAVEAALLKLGQRRRQKLLAPPGNHELRSGLAVGLGDGLADAAAAPGDQRDVALEAEEILDGAHVVSSLASV
jgi:hypothetical protein